MINLIFLALSSIIKFVSPKLQKDEWSDINAKLKIKLTPINYHLCRASNPDDIIALGDQANIVIRDFLVDYPEVFEAKETGKETKYVKHVPKSMKEATNLKNQF